MKVNIKIAFKKIEHDNVLSGAIGWWTKSKFYHTELILGDKWITSDNNQGVIIRDLKPLNNKWVYKNLGFIEVTDKQYKIILDWINEQYGKEYDYIGILYSQFLPFRYDDKNEWFCSEIVTKILQLFLIKEVLDLVPNLTSPGDLAKIFKVE